MIHKPFTRQLSIFKIYQEVVHKGYYVVFPSIHCLIYIQNIQGEGRERCTFLTFLTLLH